MENARETVTYTPILMPNVCSGLGCSPPDSNGSTFAGTRSLMQRSGPHNSLIPPIDIFVLQGMVVGVCLWHANVARQPCPVSGVGATPSNRGASATLRKFDRCHPSALGSCRADISSFRCGFDCIVGRRVRHLWPHASGCALRLGDGPCGRAAPRGRLLAGLLERN